MTVDELMALLSRLPGTAEVEIWHGEEFEPVHDVSMVVTDEATYVYIETDTH
jgi:hypothetical protein